MSEEIRSLARTQADKADAAIADCLNRRKSFIVEAGAGAGKTYSLVKALRWLLASRRDEFESKGGRIACITYTNVARDEISSRIDGDPLVLPSTIHSFCWECSKDFQNNLRSLVSAMPEFIELMEVNQLNTLDGFRIGYDFGFRSIGEGQVLYLHHSDVLKVFSTLMENKKFRELVYSKFPVILIDEYQDTASNVMDSFLSHFVEEGAGPQLGLFGDHWQKIYDDGCGSVLHESLAKIDKHCNFRSSAGVVEVLNRMRPELVQEPEHSDIPGAVNVYLTNSWKGTRRMNSHWKGDLPEEVSREALDHVRRELCKSEWDFQNGRTKTLMLTHKILAREQNYKALADCFSRSESYAKKENKLVEFFADVLEPFCESYSRKAYGQMFHLLGLPSPCIRSVRDKQKWKQFLCELLSVRETGSVKDVLTLLRARELPRLPDKVIRLLSEIESAEATGSELNSTTAQDTQKFLSIPYAEVISLVAYLDGQSGFSTKHNVKGAEFEDVLVVVGRGWSNYDFSKMMGMFGDPRSKDNALFVRSRNLFYVSCSRPKNRLAILFTQQVDDDSHAVLRGWFGNDAIKEIGLNLS